MADVYDAQTRSRVMRAVKSCNTRPEKQVRSMLHRLGFRFRLHQSDLPGKPDIVLPRYRAVVLVHGCFFHVHSCRRGLREPKTNVSYWRQKRSRNVQRDRQTYRHLRAAGWKVLVVWECQLAKPDTVALRLQRELRQEAI